jgi:hypothetical protein
MAQDAPDVVDSKDSGFDKDAPANRSVSHKLWLNG